MRDTTAVDILRKAADEVDSYGIAYGRFRDPETGGRCVAVTLHEAHDALHGADDLWAVCGVRRLCATRLAVLEAVTDEVGSVMMWNDNVRPTAELVAKTFRKVADDLEATGGEDIPS